MAGRPWLLVRWLQIESRHGQVFLFVTLDFCLLVCCLRNINIRICKTILLSVVLYGCEAWSQTLREERSLKIFEFGVLKKTFGPTTDETTGGWGWLRNEGPCIVHIFL
jgi:hypothetical protein